MDYDQLQGSMSVVSQAEPRVESGVEPRVESGVESGVEPRVEPARDYDMIRDAALRLPEADSASAKAFTELLSGYGMATPNPRLFWYDPTSLSVLGRTLSHGIHNKMRDEIMAKKPKSLSGSGWEDMLVALGSGKNPGVSDEKWSQYRGIYEEVKKIRSDYQKDIDAAIRLLPGFIEDMKGRRDKIKSHPEYKAWAGSKNTGWVDDASKVEAMIKRFSDELKSPVSTGAPKSQPAVRMLEVNKFDILKNFLDTTRHSFSSLADQMGKASMDPIVGTSGEFGQAIAAQYKDIQDRFQEASKTLHDKTDKSVSEEDKKISDGLRNEIIEISKELNSIQQYVKSVGGIPATHVAQMIGTFASYFSRLYSFMSSIRWFSLKYAGIADCSAGSDELSWAAIRARYEQKYGVNHHCLRLTCTRCGNTQTCRCSSDKTEEFGICPSCIESMKVGAEGDEPKTEEQVPPRKLNLDELNRLRDTIITKCKDVIARDIKAKGPILGDLAVIKSSVKKLVAGLREREYELRVHTAAFDDDYEQHLRKFIFPDPVLNEADKLIGKLKELDNKEKKPSEDARKELETIISRFVEAYKERIPDDKIHEVAKDNNITPAAAALKLKKHQEALAKAAMDQFIMDWRELIDYPKKKERSDLGNRPSHEYEKMEAFVDRHIPELAQAVPVVTEQEPKMSIPTPEHIRKMIEDEWSRKPMPTPEALKKIYTHDVADWPTGGSEKAKSRSRKKAIKPPIPIGTWEDIKLEVLDLLRKHDSPEDIVLREMMRYIPRVKRALADGQYIFTGDVVDALVALLKNLKNVIINLRVHPSKKPFNIPPGHDLQLSGSPDLIIDSYKDGMALFNKIVGIYDVINSYIAPDTVGVPPKSLKNLQPTKIQRYFPYDFVNVITLLQEEEGKAPPAPPPEKYQRLPRLSDVAQASPMSLRVASKFAGTSDSVPELDSYLS